MNPSHSSDVLSKFGPLDHPKLNLNHIKTLILAIEHPFSSKSQEKTRNKEKKKRESSRGRVSGALSEKSRKFAKIFLAL